MKKNVLMNNLKISLFLICFLVSFLAESQIDIKQSSLPILTINTDAVSGGKEML